MMRYLVLTLCCMLSLTGCSFVGGGPDTLPRMEAGAAPPLNPTRALDIAILQAQKVASDKPGDATAQIALGDAYMARGWSAEAESIYRGVIEAEPDNARGWNNLALALLRLREREEALKALKRSLELDPNFAEAHYNLASIYEQQQKFAQALAHYRLALLGNPALGDPLVNPRRTASRVVQPAILTLYLESAAALALEPDVATRSTGGL